MAFETERMRLPVALCRAAPIVVRSFFARASAAWRNANPRSRLGAEPHAHCAGCRTVLRLCFDEFLAPDYALPDPETRSDQSARPCRDRARLERCRRFSPPIAAGSIRSRILRPLKWWSPPPRSVLFFNELHVAKRLRRQMRQERLHGHASTATSRASSPACAGHRAWPLASDLDHAADHARLCRIVRCRLRAFVRSLERARRIGRRRLWRCARRVPSSPSLSSRANPTRRRSVSPRCNWHLARWGFAFNDGKLMTPTCHDMGFREIPRDEYPRASTQAARRPDKPGRWQIETDAEDGRGLAAGWVPAYPPLVPSDADSPISICRSANDSEFGLGCPRRQPLLIRDRSGGTG